MIFIYFILIGSVFASVDRSSTYTNHVETILAPELVQPELFYCVAAQILVNDKVTNKSVILIRDKQKMEIGEYKLNITVAANNDNLSLMRLTCTVVEPVTAIRTMWWVVQPTAIDEDNAGFLLQLIDGKWLNIKLYNLKKGYPKLNTYQH